ncbi:O-antigen polymerase [Ectopseudomonas mendocina]
MLDVAFWFFYLLAPVVVWLLLRVAGENINKISILNVVTVSIYAFSVLGLFPLFYKLDQYRVYTGVTNQKLVFIVLLCSFTAIVCFLLGAVFIRRAMGLKPYPIVSSEIKPLERMNFAALMVALGCVVVVLALYLMKVEHIALFVAIKDGAEAAAIARSEMGNNFPKYHRYGLIMHDLGVVVTLSFFTLWLLKKDLVRLALFSVAFVVSAFIAVMATEKAPLVWLFVGMFMVYYVVRKDGVVPKRDVALLGLCIVIILFVFNVYFMGSDYPLMSVFSRAFAGSISPAYFYLEYVPYVRDFYWFTTFPNPGGFLPYESARYTVEIMNWKFPENMEKGIVGSMPTVFWGEAYLNFGFLGVPVVAFIMGCFVAVVSFLVSRLELNAISIAFAVWVMLHLKSLGVTGFSGFLCDFYMISIGVMVFIMLFVALRFKLRRR